MSLLALLVLATGVAVHQAVSVVDSFHALGLLDVQIYRMGGAAVLRGEDLYEVGHTHGNLPFTYPPFAAILFVPLHVLGWTGAPVAITVASLAAVGRCSVLLARAMTNGPDGDRRASRWMAAVLALCCLAIWPTRSTLEFGQINLVLMWLVLEDVLGAGRSARWSGALTGVATAVKLTPAFLIAFFVACGEYRRAVNATVVTALAVILGFIVVPADSWHYWTRLIFDPARVGAPGYLANQSLNGVLTRLAGGPPSFAVQLLTGVVVGAAILIVGASLWRSGQVPAAVATAVLGPLLLSPISWMHHWVWMAVFLAVLVRPVPGERTVPRAVRWALLGLLLLVSLPRPMSFLPNGEGREYGLPLAAQAVAGAYVLVGLGLLAHLAWRAVPRSTGSAAPTDPAVLVAPEPQQRLAVRG